ncbi:unnamed protein product [Allacma fusca]|uniref:Uncharacterized protein n=1 Tax=Allacma fusca TaxID=39272 RepID=A0A8J2PCQ5_9HEXA|nr:unnamed protein product [Allacma fusca]
MNPEPGIDSSGKPPVLIKNTPKPAPRSSSYQTENHRGVLFDSSVKHFKSGFAESSSGTLIRFDCYEDGSSSESNAAQTYAPTLISPLSKISSQTMDQKTDAELRPPKTFKTRIYNFFP